MRVPTKRGTAALLLSLVVNGCGGSGSPVPSASSTSTGAEATQPPSSGPTMAPPPSARPIAAAGWTSAGTLADARVGHTATLLADGRVLVAGGLDIEGAAAEGVEVKGLTSAEVYDPASGDWSATGPMATGRAFHTATLLLDGTVLVAGGGEAGEAAARSAEIYDPRAGLWATVPSMASGRFEHTAFLLPSGEVLAVGGHGLGSEPTALTSADRYDPVTRTWRQAASLVTASNDQTGIALTEGRALLVQGGFRDPAATWIYNPATDTWAGSGSMGQARHGFPLALLPGGTVLAPGGGIGMADGVLATAQVFDPMTGAWRDTGTMGLQRWAFTITALPDGRVVAVGGGGADDAGARSVEIYEPVSGTWSAVGSMVDPRSGHTATLLTDGSILVVGGYNGAGTTTQATAERFVPVSR